MHTKKIPLMFALAVVAIVSAIGFSYMTFGVGWLVPVPAMCSSSHRALRSPQRFAVLSIERTDGIPDGKIIQANNPNSKVLGYTLTNEWSTDAIVKSVWVTPTNLGSLSTMQSINSLKLYDDHGMLVSQFANPHTPGTAQTGAVLTTDLTILPHSKQNFWITADVDLSCAATGTFQLAVIDMKMYDSNNVEQTVYRIPGAEPLSPTTTVPSAIFQVVPR